MGTLAISFCNQRAGDALLALVDPSSGAARPLDFGHPSLVSGVGLARDGDTLYCACSEEDQTSYLAAFDLPSGALRGLVRLDAVVDVHSICLDGDAVLAVSTGTDEVVRIEGRGIGRAEPLWACAPGRSDTQHLNAIARAGGALLVSGFGAKDGGTWATARDGYIYDVAASRYVARGLAHPHSVVAHGGIVYVCESSRQSIRTLAADIFYVDGYARGLAFSGATMYAGSSIGRGTGGIARPVFNPAEGGFQRGRCTVTTLEAGRARTLDLSHLGNEIYDVLDLGAIDL